MTPDLVSAARPAGFRCSRADQIGRLVVLARHPICLVATVLGTIFTSFSPLDLGEFAEQGRVLLTTRWTTIYSTSWTQAGPLQLLVSRALMIGGGVGGRPSVVLVAGLNATVVALTMRAWRSDTDSAVRARRQLVVGMIAAVWVTRGMLWSGHPAEAAVAVLWFLGLRAAQGGRSLRAAAALGLACGFAPWAVLVLPGALITRGRQAIVIAAGAGSLQFAGTCLG